LPSLIYFTNATYDAKRRVTGLYANAQIEDDGPNRETYHEGTYRCSRVGHADCQPDLAAPKRAHVIEDRSDHELNLRRHDWRFGLAQCVHYLLI
jgi:hypothetical protein